MICVGSGLIFLAIRKGFEPLLLLPIGFGCILANVPVAGLAEDAIGHLLLAADPAHLSALASVLAVPVEQLDDAVKLASGESLYAAKFLAQNLGYEPGMLYQFYSIAIGSGCCASADLHGCRCTDRFRGPDCQALDAAAGCGRAVRDLLHPARGARAERDPGFRLYPGGCVRDRDHRRRRRPDRDLPGLEAGSGPVRCHRGRGILLHGAGADHPAADHARVDHRGRAAGRDVSAAGRSASSKRSFSR
jgi:hypothetical protein